MSCIDVKNINCSFILLIIAMKLWNLVGMRTVTSVQGFQSLSTHLVTSLNLMRATCSCLNCPSQRRKDTHRNHLQHWHNLPWQWMKLQRQSNSVRCHDPLPPLYTCSVIVWQKHSISTFWLKCSTTVNKYMIMPFTQLIFTSIILVLMFYIAHNVMLLEDTSSW